MANTESKAKKQPKDKKSDQMSRREDKGFITLTMLVKKEWSDKISKIARDKGMTKTSYIQNAVNKEIDGVTTEIVNTETLEAIEELNKKVERLTELNTAILNLISKL